MGPREKTPVPHANILLWRSWLPTGRSQERGMRLTLTSAKQQAITRVSRLLTAPLEFPSADAWRAAVNRALTELLNGDSAAFVIPGVGGAVFFSEEHDP